jgi:hypothetical protein
VGAGPRAVHIKASICTGMGDQPRDSRFELMEFIELRRLHQGIEADCVTEAGRRATLVREGAMVLENLGTPLILGITQDHVKGAYDSGHSPWD